MKWCCSDCSYELHRFATPEHIPCAILRLNVHFACLQAEILRLRYQLQALQNPQGLFFAEGVQLELPESLLAGWTKYYCAPYRLVTALARTQKACHCLGAYTKSPIANAVGESRAFTA